MEACSQQRQLRSWASQMTAHTVTSQLTVALRETGGSTMPMAKPSRLLARVSMRHPAPLTCIPVRDWQLAIPSSMKRMEEEERMPNRSSEPYAAIVRMLHLRKK